MTTSTNSEHPVEERLWFGPADRRLFGCLTRPTATSVRGGVLLAPPLGLEGHPARRALRSLALALAARGFVSLRFDYDGTGDSSGGFDDPDRDRAWVSSVAEAAKLLRALGLTSISAVGMRLGALLAGVAASEHDLGLSSLVLWDPCESGRSYLRELRAFEALRREDGEVDASGAIEASEFVMSPQAASQLRRLSLPGLPPGPLAARTLVVARDDRVISEKLRVRLEEGAVDWETTSEQGALIDVDALVSVMPVRTMDRIAQWLSEGTPSSQVAIGAEEMASLVSHELDLGSVRERTVQLGPRRLFGIVSEPVGDVRGPLIVMLNVSKGDHTGPARLWVVLSRRWASFGLRCVRFDLSGLGESPWCVGESAAVMFDRRWNEDVPDVIRELEPLDPTNVVLIGLCSGAFLAIEGALSLRARGACVINPPVGLDFLHATSRMGRSRRAPVRALAVRLNEVLLRLRWVAAAVWEVCRLVLPASCTLDLASKVADNGTDLLWLATSEDTSPYAHVPFLRGVDRRRWLGPKSYKIEFVPGLDHSMHRALGRARVVAVLDRHVLEHFAGVFDLPAAEETRPIVSLDLNRL